MTVRQVTLDGKDYVLVPRKQWESFASKSSADKGRMLKQPPLLPDGNYGIEHVRISLANKIIARRKAAGLTQSQLARLARVRVETISRLENGLHMPSARTFDKIERAIKRSTRRPAA
jgi:DNA-binding XRE family transcriptional regulator